MKRDSDKFHLMRVFHEVAVKGSFTLAAKRLGMTTSSVSKAVQQLEQNLNTTLLYRTTRSQSLTDNGRLYQITARQILTQLGELEDTIQSQGTEPSGLLRITAPTALGQFFIGPRIHEFLQQHPKVKVDLVLNERLVDITEEGFDLAIRSVDVPERSPLYSYKIGTHERRLVASPEYLQKVPLPQWPEQLTGMQILNYKGTPAESCWSFFQSERTSIIDIEPVYSSNNYYALLTAAKKGVGVANLYQYMVDDEVKAGNLIPLLTQWQQPPRNRFAVYQQRRDMSPKIDAFLAFLETLFV